MTHQQQVVITTSGHGDMHDLAGEVAEVVTASGHAASFAGSMRPPASYAQLALWAGSMTMDPVPLAA